MPAYPFQSYRCYVYVLKIGPPVGHRVGNRVGYRVGYRVGNRVGNRVGYRVGRGLLHVLSTPGFEGDLNVKTAGMAVCGF